MSNAWEVTTIAGDGPVGFEDDHSTHALLSGPARVCISHDGRLYISDKRNHRIRMIDHDQVKTLAGNGYPGFQDGNTLNAMFQFPYAICISHVNQLYVSDTYNHRVRMIYNGQVTTLAGNGTKGFQDGDALNAMFCYPTGICITNDGKIYISDSENDMIRMVYNDKVTTIAGNGTSGFRDGPSHDAMFHYPVEIGIADDGKLYVADNYNHRIRMIYHHHVMTVAGDGKRGFQDGDSIKSMISYPKGLCVSHDGKIYISDTQSNRIRMIYNNQTTTIAGNDKKGFQDGDSAHAMFHYPDGICISRDGSIYVIDSWNHRIRRINSNHLAFTFNNALQTPILLDYEIMINAIPYQINKKFIAVRYPSLLDDACCKLIEASTIDNSTIERFIRSLHTHRVDDQDKSRAIITTDNIDTLQQILFQPNTNIDQDYHHQHNHFDRHSHPLLELSRLAYQQTNFPQTSSTSYKPSLYHPKSLMDWCTPDFVIMLSNDDTLYHVHKFILCGRWRYFALLLHSGLQEARENKMILSEDWTRSRLEKWMKYIYLDEIDFHDVDDIVWLFKYAQLYTIARYNDGALLQSMSQEDDETRHMIACEGFESLYSHCVSILNGPLNIHNCITKYLLFQQLGPPSQLEMVFNFMVTHFDAIMENPSTCEEMERKMDDKTIVKFLFKKYRK